MILQAGWIETEHQGTQERVPRQERESHGKEVGAYLRRPEVRWSEGRAAVGSQGPGTSRDLKEARSEGLRCEPQLSD